MTCHAMLHLWLCHSKSGWRRVPHVGCCRCCSAIHPKRMHTLQWQCVHFGRAQHAKHMPSIVMFFDIADEDRLNDISFLEPLDSRKAWISGNGFGALRPCFKYSFPADAWESCGIRGTIIDKQWLACAVAIPSLVPVSANIHNVVACLIS